MRLSAIIITALAQLLLGSAFVPNWPMIFREFQMIEPEPEPRGILADEEPAPEPRYLVEEPEPEPKQGTCDCGKRGTISNSTSDERIVGGREATQNEIPWRAALYATDGKSRRFFCGGSVISPSYIVTAAHCTQAANDAGEHDLSTTSEANSLLIEADKVIQHPLYNPITYNNDIALIKLRTPYNTERDSLGPPKIAPVCLPVTKDAGLNPAGGKVLASGWGVTQEGNDTTPDLLRCVELPFIPLRQCQQVYGRARVNTNMICTYEPGKDTCQGDSGGSIDSMNAQSSRYTAVGITSWGVGCARERRPGVYTKIGNYIRWIKEKIGSDQPCFD